MDLQDKTSDTIVDHRKVGAVSIAAFIALLIGAAGGRASAPAPDPDNLVKVVSTAMDRGDDYWTIQYPGFHPARIVLFDDAEPTACGQANSLTGPFYCEVGERIYLDLSFLRAIKGDLARAYVVAHELGHHVQKLTGELARLADRSVDLELEADCFAGAWMRREKDLGHLAAGDLDDAVAEASAVGDDRLSPDSAPETWAHGSAAQRAKALKIGFGGHSCKP